ncbi:MAG: periplasmic sugar-binding protein of ABC transporter [Bacteroidia bacterium]|nr:MAG: periplasmic sugar-binding protein of ABC transporter [Bacteroidia bacterium]
MKTIFKTGCVVLASFLISCSGGAKGEGEKTIGVALLTRGHVFYRDLEAGLRSEAQKKKYDLVITSAEFDLGKQISQIEDFVTRKVDAIIVCPVDSRGIGPGIRKANDAGIPVFTADITATEGAVVSHIASDNIAGGRLAGEYLAKALHGKGKVAIINHPAVTSVLDRVQGFKEALSAHPHISIVADVNGQGVRDKALQAATDVLQAHTDLDAIFGINDDSALGALDAVEQFRREGVIIVGYDATPPAADAILRATALKADVVQYPTVIGTTTIQTIADFFSGREVPPIVPVQVGIIDKTALEKTANQGAN